MLNHRRKFNCEKFRKIFSIKTELEEHMKKPHEAKIKFLPCTGCEAKFKADRSLKQHVNAVHEASIKLFQCTGCEAKFTAENALNNTSMQFMKPRSNCYSAGHYCDYVLAGFLTK